MRSMWSFHNFRPIDIFSNCQLTLKYILLSLHTMSLLVWIAINFLFATCDVTTESWSILHSTFRLVYYNCSNMYKFRDGAKTMFISIHGYENFNKRKLIYELILTYIYTHLVVAYFTVYYLRWRWHLVQVHLVQIQRRQAAEIYRGLHKWTKWALTIYRHCYCCGRHAINISLVYPTCSMYKA